MIYDKEFLLSLDKIKEKEIYAKVTALTFQESPITNIEGRITAGTISVDGNSAVRRTCSLTMVAENLDCSNYTWGLNTKFKLEIGVKNNINNNYPDIIWFQQGIYILTSFNTSRSTTNFTINLQGKDKMCLLNGDVGGNIESTVDFGTEETVNAQGYRVIRKIPIADIIRNMVHHYGGEPYYNIIINDLDDYGYELLEYKYDTDLYLYRDVESDTPYYHNILLGDKSCKIEGRKDISKLSDLKPTDLDMLVDSLTGNPNPAEVIIGEETNKKWYVAKVQFGQTAGYRQTDLTYAGDLIASAGSSITSVLDKIKAMLSDFEYFYNLEGQFVFQRKQSFINTLWSPAINNKDDEQYIENLALASSCSYVFSGGELITSINNNPNLLNVKNDYSIWGTKDNIQGSEPVHMRYAIDIKPTEYISIDTTDDEAIKLIDEYNKKYESTLKCQTSFKYTSEEWDWRELIYKMAQDYFKYAHIFDDFEARIRKANPIHFPIGITGYEQYYTDIISFWRELYDPDLQSKIEEKAFEKQEYDNIIYTLKRDDIYTDESIIKDYIYIPDEMLPENIPLLQKMIIYQDAEITQLKKESNGTDYQKIDDNQNNLTRLQLYFQALTSKLNTNTNLSAAADEVLQEYEKKIKYYYDKDSLHPYWNIKVYEHPEQLVFWFDFISEGELSNFNVKAIGARPKVINDSSVKAIYFRETPDVIFITSDNEIGTNTAFRYIQVTNIDSMFSVSSQGKSAKDRLDELIYQHGYCNENVTINTIPVYYLQPNTRIHLFDDKTNLNGDYVINKITIPLTYNGTMQITASKAAENII